MRTAARFLFPVLLLLLPAPATAQYVACAPEPPSDSLLAFVGVKVVPMARDTVLADQTVLVRGGRIAAVGRRGRVRVPAGATRIEGRGRWLMPGLVDAHVHTVGRGAGSHRLFLLGLAQGVTGAVVLSGDTAALRMREDFARGARPGPTLYVAGPLVNDSVLTDSGGVRVAEEHLRSGYDLVKVYGRLSKPGYRGVVRRARELGIPVVGHVVRSMDVEGVLGARQRGIVHMEEYLYTYFGLKLSDTTHVAEERLDPAALPYLAAATAGAGTYVTPTLATFEGMAALAEDLEGAMAQPGVQYLGKELRDALRAHGKGTYADRFSHPRQRRNLRHALEFQRRMISAFHRARVPLLTGTDAPIAVTLPGYGVRRELRNLVEAGLSPFEALSAATRNAARYLGREEEFGTVEVGRRADILLLEADPLADVAAVERVAGVMARGRWLDAGRLRGVLACLEGEGRE